VPPEAVAQRERVLQAVLRHGDVIDHLWLDPKRLVRAEEGVVHKVAVVARHVGGRPDRIHDLQVGLCNEPEGPTALLGVDRRRTQGYGSGRRGRASEELPATETAHAGFPFPPAGCARLATNPCFGSVPLEAGIERRSSGFSVAPAIRRVVTE